jgi:hypothetical protein
VQLPLISVALWDIEPVALRRQLRVIVSRPRSLSRESTRAPASRSRRVTRARRRRRTQQRLGIPYPDRREGSIGTLTITPNVASLYPRLAERILAIVLGFAMLAAAVCGLTYAVLRDELARPMRKLARFTGS